MVSGDLAGEPRKVENRCPVLPRQVGDRGSSVEWPCCQVPLLEPPIWAEQSEGWGPGEREWAEGSGLSRSASRLHSVLFPEPPCCRVI